MAAPFKSMVSMVSTLFPTGMAHYLAGGLLIGLGVALLYLMQGHMAGMSTFFSSSWSWLVRRPHFQQGRLRDSRSWRAVLALGLVLGGTLWWWLLGPAEPLATQVPAWQLLGGGLLVGYGARLSGGCTSGHGICGLSALQAPSLAAVLIFMATAFSTALGVAALKGST